ncbi:UNVERIFIED_CONTAM: hypothetical protein FKN15_057603 [Acipenser sinensis]
MRRNSPWRFCLPSPRECQSTFDTLFGIPSEDRPLRTACRTSPVHLVAVLLPGMYSFAVSELSLPGAQVGRLSALDPDVGENAALEYSILDGDGGGAFNLTTQEEEGVLTLNQSIRTGSCPCCGVECREESTGSGEKERHLKTIAKTYFLVRDVITPHHCEPACHRALGRTDGPVQGPDPQLASARFWVPEYAFRLTEEIQAQQDLLELALQQLAEVRKPGSPGQFGGHQEDFRSLSLFQPS